MEAKIATGTVIAVIGFIFILCTAIQAITGKEVPIFKYLIAKSSELWHGKVYAFYIISGIIMMVLGILCATGIIWR